MTDLDPQMVANLVTKHDPDGLARMLLRSEINLAETTEEVSALFTLTRKQALSEQALRRELSKQRKQDPGARDIQAILRLWRALCSTKRASIELDGKRADIVRKALKSLTHGTPKDRRRMCMDAIRGLALRPYVVNAQRKGSGPPECRYADVEHALKDEKHIEEHAGYYRTVAAKPLEWKHRAWVASMTVESGFRALFLDELFKSQRLERVPSLESGRHLFVVPDPEEKAA